MAPQSGDSDRLTDLTGDSIQSVMALEITKEAQIAGKTDAGGVSANARAGVAAGQQLAASSDRPSPCVSDSFEYRRKCGWVSGLAA